MTRAKLGVVVVAMVAGGLAVGCSSNGTATGRPDAQAPGLDAPAGGGGAVGSGSDAAAAGSGGSGGVSESGGITTTARSTGDGGATGSGGTTGVGGATQTGGTTGTGGATGSGGVTSLGGSSVSGGAGGSGSTSSTSRPDASTDKPLATWGTPCRSDDDCQPTSGMYLTCHTPGASSGCAPCRMGPSDCSIDADCVGDGGSTTGTMICETQMSGACYCPAVNYCVPGCRTNADCGSGQGCNEGHRCEDNCFGDGTCPVNTSCRKTGFCRTNSCTSDSECSGFCVLGWCYQTRGTCAPIPG
jgi:hypothetical protein